ncbi:S8 family peptidase [Geomesophilobacter sediminis]|uniref:S8 family peptidase n=1 Tax=Geomesophilobacter sediminis TaxID=2798584 RepID=A0A8J7IPG4_9BACT|nr:S8 family peptidase [Geomesophilobacter sediminis]MBJ6725448.1 S8 family peptidase [Geomesophilobacter sediminis]
MPYPHLTLQREAPTPEKRPRRGFPGPPPADPAAHGRALRARLAEAVTQVETDLGGFDDRLLFKFEVQKGFDPDDLQKVSNEIEIVSQEGEQVVVAFVSAGALRSFEARLSTLARGEKPVYVNVLYALNSLNGWLPEDRTGWALTRDGFPEGDSFALDVELWPIEDNNDERELLINSFNDWLTENEIRRLDSVRQPGIIVYRVRCNREQAENLLRHRDVRTVDLPPSYRLSIQILQTNIQELTPPPSPPEDSPRVAVLDSGIVSNHPLLGPAVGAERSFIDAHGPSDTHGHGTNVAGIAVYGDVAAAITNDAFTPNFWVCSGRVLDGNGETDAGFIENQIIDAVRYFHDEYDCRVYNVSIGDLNKPYLGGHIRSFSQILDLLARELDVLFVVSTGNVSIDEMDALSWKQQYPAYLTRDQWAIIEPAPALNVLTVGSLARYDQNVRMLRWPDDPGELPIARHGQPSPFTRRGPSVGGAIKPDLVAYGGNWAFNTRGNNVSAQHLGVVTTNRTFTEDGLFKQACGTSFATPYITYLAGKVLCENPTASQNLLRALLIAHARVPEGSEGLFPEKEAIRSILGYGAVDAAALCRSRDNHVTMIVEGTLEDKRHHFYEVPIPEDFLSQGKRDRELTVALAYAAPVRSTRVAYKATRVEFRVVAAPDLDHVATMFNRATSAEDYQSIPEIGNASLGPTMRSKGTVQGDTWTFKQFNTRSKLVTNRLFIVVTRNDFGWGSNVTATHEQYALAVSLSDRANQNARLYAQVQARLQTRVRVRQ